MFHPYDFPKRPVKFNNRFLRTRSHPDFNDVMIRRGKGEFSIETDLRFEKHLRKMSIGLHRDT